MRYALIALAMTACTRGEPAELAMDSDCVGASCTPRLCEDGDGDGFGAGCAAGPDCDDTAPLQTGVEVCDGHDNDCDGTVDNGVLSPCGDCDSTCSQVAYGLDGTPFPAPQPEDGVILANGALTLDPALPAEPPPYIWIAQTSEGTIAKIHTRTFEQLARYYTGPRVDNTVDDRNDPSRTSVGLDGSVYVANRAGDSIAKILPDGPDCPDTNGDGVVTTSTGPLDVLPWGMDDCIAWHVPLPPGTEPRGMAADHEYGLDGVPVPVVYVGGSNTSATLWKLDGFTGETRFTTKMPVPAYGFALDGVGNLWISRGGAVGRMDLTRCRNAVSCDAPCDGDDCIKSVVPVPKGVAYGITVDGQQRVWIGGNGVRRYDPYAPVDSRWAGNALGPFISGVAADNQGNVWGAGSGLFRFSQEDPEQYIEAPGTKNRGCKGAAVDVDQRAWCIPLAARNVDVAEPIDGGTFGDIDVQQDAIALLDRNGDGVAEAPAFSETVYTYSDMTGQQLANAVAGRGQYALLLQGCPSVRWKSLHLDADIPETTSVLIRVRTADSTMDLAVAKELLVLERYGNGEKSVSLTELLDGTPGGHGTYLSLRIYLAARSGDALPLVRGLRVNTSGCETPPS